MNKKLISLISGTLLLTAMVVGADSYWDAPKPVAKISFPLGNVLVLPSGKTKLVKAGFNRPLYNGDKIKTQPSARCEIKYNDGSIVRIDERSIYTIERAEIKKKEKKVESFLSVGRIWANIKKLAQNTDQWLLRGPSAVVAVRGTVYRMDAAEDKTSRILVYEGSVNVAPPGWQPGQQQQQGGQPPPGPPQRVQGPTQVKGPSVVSLKEWIEIVKAQQQIVVKPDGSFQKSDFDAVADAKSSWVQWNLKRDKLIK